MSEDEFGNILAGQVRIKRRTELLTMFAGFEREQTELNNKTDETVELSAENKELSNE